MSTSIDSTARTGVCLTGEARSFRFAGVRQQLRRFLSAVNAQTVLMTLFRRATCDGLVLGRNATLCRLTRAHAFGLSYAELQREFPSARITLVDESTCDNGRNMNEACCSQSQATGIKPIGWLQYIEVARCMRSLLRHNSHFSVGLTHVIRARPDTLFLDAAMHSIDLRRIRAPTWIRKAENGSRQSASTRWVGPKHIGFLRHGSTEVHQPGDHFWIVPIRHVQPLIDGLINSLEAPCKQPTSSSSANRLKDAAAMSRTPETKLLVDRKNRYKGVECGNLTSDADGDWHWGLQHRCIESFPVVIVRANGEADCHRLADGEGCAREVAAAVRL